MTYTIDTAQEIHLSLNPTSEEEVLQNVYCLVETTLGDVPCYREYGIDKSYISMPSNVGENLALSAIAEAMTKFFPELQIGQVVFTADPEHPDIMSAKIEVMDGYE